MINSFQRTMSLKEHKRSKMWVYFVLRVHKSLIMPRNTDQLTIRSYTRLDEVCKSIMREFYVARGLLPQDHVYSMKFKYQNFMPKFRNFIQIENQTQYNSALESHR